MSNTITNNTAHLPVASQAAPRTDKAKKEEEKKIPGVLTEEQLKALDEIVRENKTDNLKLNQELGKDQFMQILLRQLSHQNPLQPMEDKEFIAQMAQFSSLESIQNLNSTFQDSFRGLGEEVGRIREIMKDNEAKHSELEATVKSIAESIAEINKAIKENRAQKAYKE